MGIDQMYYGMKFKMGVTKIYTVMSHINKSQFNLKSRFKEQNIVTEIEFHIEK